MALYQRVVDANGNASFVEVAEPSAAGIASVALKSLGQAVVDVGSRVPKSAAATAAVALAPTLADNASNAVIHGLAGDYIGAVQYGIPFLVGVFGALVGMLTPSPSQNKGLSDDEIKNHVAAISRDELIRLLQQPVETGLNSAVAGNVQSAHQAV